MEEFQFTKRVHNILKIAAEEEKVISFNQFIYLLACVKKVLAYAASCICICFVTWGRIFRKLSLRKQDDLTDQEYEKIGQYKVSYKVLEILQIAKKRMERFQQVLMNEGHVIYALFRADTFIENPQIQKEILRIVEEPRDLAVDLKCFVPAYTHLTCHVRKANSSDFGKLVSFVSEEFGERWLHSIEYGFRTYKENVPIYIAEQKEVIVGFACYDVVRGKKGLFGPMGTAKQNRVKSVGKQLLHCSLHSMKQDGYEYAIIGQAGPVEFYERCCNARLIPIMDY